MIAKMSWAREYVFAGAALTIALSLMLAMESCAAPRVANDTPSEAA